MGLPRQMKERAFALLERLSACDLCPRRCGVNRRQGGTGFCKTAEDAEVAHIGLHFGEEPPISGGRGSGTIFFAHCNLRCVFCQNYQISQCADEIDTWLVNPQELADVMLELERRGAHNVNWVSPSLDSLQALDGLVKIYMPDIKYSDNAMAKRYSGADDYVEVSRQAIAEMFRQVGPLQLDDEGIAQRGVLVRHLVLPQNVAGSKASLEFLASLSKDMAISLMSQYSPQYKAEAIAPINRRLSRAEYEDVLDTALELNLENCYIQELDSSSVLLPDFRQERPFAG
jgi:putative pyruvate formate lyase activating enzyme